MVYWQWLCNGNLTAFSEYCSLNAVLVNVCIHYFAEYGENLVWFYSVIECMSRKG